MNRAQLAAALTAGTITQAQHDARLAALVAAEQLAAGAPTAGIPAELAAGPEPVGPGTQRIQINETLSLDQAARRVVTAATSRDPARAVQLALAELLPAADAGNAFIGRADWIGEVWQASGPDNRPWIDSFGPVGQLTGTKIEGFKWGNEPEPEKYAGLLAAVPTNGFSTVPVSAEPERWAWAARLDRIFRDLGSEDLVRALFAKLAVNYRRVSERDIALQVLAAATEPVDGALVPIIDTTVLGSLKAAARNFRTIGATMDQVWLADDLFDAWSDMKLADLPAWLAASIGLNIVDGTTQVGTLTIAADSKLSAGELVAYDKRAVSIREKTPIELEALVIPNGGLDIGFFSYGGLLVNDARAIQKRTVDLVP